MNKLHDLTAKIINKEPRKVYNKDSKYLGNSYYRLGIIQENKTTEEALFAYPNLIDSEFFQIIENSRYIDKRYLFFCEKKPKGWVLHRWEELPSKPPP